MRYPVRHFFPQTQFKHVTKKEVISELQDYIRNWKAGYSDAMERTFMIQYKNGTTKIISDDCYTGTTIQYKNIQGISMTSVFENLIWIKKR